MPAPVTHFVVMGGNRILLRGKRNAHKPDHDPVVKSVVITALFPEAVRSADALIRALRLAAEDGFYDTVEFYYEGDLSAAADIRKALDRFAEPSVFLGGAYLKSRKLNLGSLDDGHRRYAISETKKLIDQAYGYGSSKILVTSGETLASAADRQESFERLAESLRELCAYAEARARERMLHITLEFFNDHGEPYFLIGPTSVTRRLAESVASEHGNFEITFDLSHVVQLGEAPAESLAKLLPYVRHVHLANCYLKNPDHPMYGDKHPPFDWPNCEVSRDDVLSFMRDLKELGFFDRREAWTMGVEVITPESADALELYRTTTRMYREWIQCLQQMREDTVEGS
jgi:Sugar phosphate isomerases/epimerases